MSQTELEQTPVAGSLEPANGAPLGEPLPEEIVVLSRMEQFAFYFTRRMNGGSWKRFWTFCQRTLGAGWIHLSTYNIMRGYGLENVEAATRERPLLLVANHRSFFDMYAVSSVLSRRTRVELWHKRIREELGIAGRDAKDINCLFHQGYQGSRFSFGYPACPNLEDQTKLFELLDPSRIDVSLSEEFQLEPEQSTSAIIVHHEEAKYFSIE